MSYQLASEAILPDHFPAEDRPIELGFKNNSLIDGTEAYWIAEESNLVEQFNLKIKPLLMHGNANHYSEVCTCSSTTTYKVWCSIKRYK